MVNVLGRDHTLPDNDLRMWADKLVTKADGGFDRTLEAFQRFFLDLVHTNLVFLQKPGIEYSKREFGYVYGFQKFQDLNNDKGSDLNLGQN